MALIDGLNADGKLLAEKRGEVETKLLSRDAWPCITGNHLRGRGLEVVSGRVHS